LHNVDETLNKGVAVSVTVKLEVPVQVYILAILTTFLFSLGCPKGNHAKCCMDGKRIRYLQIVSQHVPIYLQHFPSYSNPKCKKSPFSRTAAHIFVSPGDALRLSRNMLHGWKENSMLAKPLAACTYLSSIVSELYDA